ncbi:MAG: hypothetical protein METHP_01374 [Methanoregula sp. SKADARSKE-2]|nr:MAG: hypothetical protein METHP_01374 [Methanoregula sp. SKADARSKE-2]
MGICCLGKGKIAFFRKIPALPFNLIEDISPEENRCLPPPVFVPFFYHAVSVDVLLVQGNIVRDLFFLDQGDQPFFAVIRCSYVRIARRRSIFRKRGQYGAQK